MDKKTNRLFRNLSRFKSKNSGNRQFGFDQQGMRTGLINSADEMNSE